MPVYVITVRTSGDKERDDARSEESPLEALARWTGGDLFVTSAPAHESIAARQIVEELRHQYVIAFSASAGSGWRALDVKTKDRDLTVRARSGYSAGQRSGS